YAPVRWRCSCGRADECGRAWPLHDEEEPLLGSLALAAPDGLLRALARAGVRLRALAVDGQPAAMPDAAIGADLGQALDRLLALTAEVALDLELAVDIGAELRHLVVGEVLDLRVRREP